jgi:hypothetical protein
MPRFVGRPPLSKADRIALESLERLIGSPIVEKRRRNLNASQRAMAVAKLTTLKRGYVECQHAGNKGASICQVFAL